MRMPAIIIYLTCHPERSEGSEAKNCRDTIQTSVATLSFVYLKVSSNQNNSNEEHNAVPANEQNELPANTPQPPLENEHAGSPETPPLILQTEPPMEVHAHTHTPRKKWTHYFWEFLMLFLAVTLGFFVENQREHYIEHERAKELAGSLYEEMRSDSANLSKMIENRKDKESHLRYLSKYFKDSSLYKLSGTFYYRFTWGVFQTSYIAFEPKDGILQQLRNSGSLRYFRNIEIQKAVGDFSVALNNLRTRLERETNLFIGKNRDFLSLPL